MPVFPSKYWLARFTPASLGNLELWLDAADRSTITLGTVTSQGPRVIQWRDKSGNERHANQATQSNQPTLRLQEQQGRDAVRFGGDSSTQFIQVNAFNAIPTNVFIVGVGGVTTGIQNYLRKGHSAGASIPLQYFFRLENGVMAWRLRDTTNADLIVTGGAASSDPAIYVGHQNPTLGYSAIWQNGEIVGQKFFDNFPGERATPNAPLRIGASFSSDSPTAAPSEILLGRICEIVITSGEVTEDERLALEGYFAWKWRNASLMLPASHPYSEGPPWKIEPKPVFYQIPNPVETRPWVPTDLGSGLRVWLDPADTSTITASSNRVSQWSDKSGNNFHVSSITTGSQPLRSTSAFGTNRPGIVFDRVRTDALRSTSAAVLSGNASCTIAAVKRFTATSTRTAIFIGDATTGNGVGSGRQDTPGYKGFIWAGVETRSLVTTINENRVQITTLQAETNLEMFLDGVAYDPKVPAATDITAGLWLGRTATGTQHMDGNLGDIVILNRVLNTDERQTLEGFLAHKYALAGSLPANHPFKDAAPVVVLNTPLEPWTPASLGASLTAWYDPSDASTVTLNGNTVAQLADKSGNNVPVTQGTQASQPLYAQGVINGRPALRFDGIDDRLQRSTKPFTLGASRSVFLVGRTRNHPEKPWTLASGGSGVTLGAIEFRAFPLAGWGMELQVRRVSIAYPTQPNFFDRNDPSPGENLAPRLVGLIQNGTVLTGHFAGTSTAGLNLRGINERNDAINEYRYADVDVGEVVVTNTALSESDREKLEGYLAHKWGLNQDLPQGHPFKRRPPYL